jgi:glycosyltransferase involved in cell wall biosynthesis
MAALSPFILGAAGRKTASDASNCASDTDTVHGGNPVIVPFAASGYPPILSPTMRLLFVHQNFPGQYVHLAPALARAGHEVRALMLEPTARDLPGVTGTRYKVLRGSTPNVHPWASEFETKILRGEGVAKAALAMRQQGFTPDVICAHPGWGEALFLRDIWPGARQLHFVEWYYGWDGHDVTFDPEFPPRSLDARLRIRTKNTHLLHGLMEMDAGISPTAWQRSTVPALFQPKVEVVHDGVDTLQIRPDADAVFACDLPGSATRLRLTRQDQVISFINRNFEPNRGYHAFLRALPALLARCTQAQVVLVGGDGVSYGAKSEDGRSWRDRFLDEIRPQLTAEQLTRLHFVGRLPHAQLIQLYQVTRAHVYLTYPFVLSWSMLEAMSAGALVIGSRTAPVEEVIEHGHNGWLVDFFDREGLARAMCDALLAPPDTHDTLRSNARDTIVSRYDLQRVCLPRQMALVERLALN